MQILIVFLDTAALRGWLSTKMQGGSLLHINNRPEQGEVRILCGDSGMLCRVVNCKDDMRALRGQKFDVVIEHPGFRTDSTPADWDGFVQVYLLRR